MRRTAAGRTRDRPARDRPARDRQAGAVTAELAVALLAVTVLLSGLTSVLAVAVAQVQVTDAASAGARLAARGESPGRVDAVVEAVAGPAASAGVSRDRDLTTVTVERVVTLWLPGSPRVPVTARAVAVTEQADP